MYIEEVFLYPPLFPSPSLFFFFFIYRGVWRITLGARAVGVGWTPSSQRTLAVLPWRALPTLALYSRLPCPVKVLLSPLRPAVSGIPVPSLVLPVVAVFCCPRPVRKPTGRVVTLRLYR